MTKFKVTTRFERPTQIKVRTPFDEGEGFDIFGAVAYLDSVICMCCGTQFDIEELADDGSEYEVLEWIDLSEEVLGDL